MLTPEDIRALGLRKYPSYLRAISLGAPFFPLKIPFGRPSTSEEWPKLQQEITALAGAAIGYRIEWAQVRTRRWGLQRMPVRVWFDDELPFLEALGKKTEVEQFRRQLTHTRAVCPELNDWLPANALQVVEFAAVWRELLLVCRHFIANPRPGIYARELPVAVDTKFIERHQGILRSLLDVVLPPSAKLETAHFEQRFGLKFEEPQIRFRILDPAITVAPGLPLSDLSVPLSQFVALPWRGVNVVIVENKKTFLSLPTLPNAVAIWGGGGAAQLLIAAAWLGQCRAFYWGDLDIHGVHILSRLRRTFATLVSVMMDADTIDRFGAHCMAGKPASYEDVSLLSAKELAAYERLKAKNLLLEQERIPHDHAVAELRRIIEEL